MFCYLRSCLYIIVLHWTHQADGKEIEETIASYDFITVKPEYIIRPKTNHTGTVIFLHGKIDTDVDIEDLKRAMRPFLPEIQHIKVIFPRAPHQPYSLMNGASRYIWFDRKWITIFEEEDLPSFEMSCSDVQNLIQNEIKAGIPLEKIIVGGFSTGGELALHVAYRYFQRMPGVFALSAFLRTETQVIEHLKENEYQHLPELFMAVGTRDDEALAYWVEDSFARLQKVKVDGSLHIMNNMEHEIRNDELDQLWGWILRHIPSGSGRRRKKIFFSRTTPSLI